MEKKSDEKTTEDWLKDIPLQTEDEGYKPEEMFVCDKCQRKNPPTRIDCLYCGADIEFNEKQSKMLRPVLRKAESHINGNNLIYLANAEKLSDEHLGEISKMTRLRTSLLKELVESGKTLPLARTETDKDLKIVAGRLAEIGIKTRVVKDEVFELEKISRRLRRIDFESDYLRFVMFNSDEVTEVDPKEITLIVIGAEFERKLEATEKYKKKGENKVLETSEISSDEILIDIYSKDDLVSYRISPNGFDFSCLGDEKKMVGIENVKILIRKLKDIAPNAQFDDDYLNLRECLADVWEVEESSDSKGMTRQSFGSYNKMSITTTSNLTQFTKYSRLQWMLASDK